MRFETKRDGMAVEFDVDKICEAIARAFESVEDVFEGINVMVKEAIENLEKALYTFAHSLAHWFLHHAFHFVTSRISKSICFDPSNAVRLAMVIHIRVKFLTMIFLEYAHVYQTACLLRTQDRGANENSNSDNFSLSYVLVQSL